MARCRMLNKAILTSQKINKVSEGAENLYYRILLLVDDYGRYYADIDIIKSHCYPKRKVSVSIIKKRLSELISVKLVKIYKDNNEEYLEVVNFQKYQKFRSDIKLKEDFPNPKAFLQGSRNKSVTERIESERVVEVTPPQHNINNNSNNNINSNIRDEVVTCLNKKANKNFSPNADKTIEFINGRLKEGYKLDDFKYVINIKVADWIDDEKMNKFLRPSTLFRKSNFENYRNETLPKHHPKVGEDISERKETDKQKAFFEKRLKLKESLYKKYKPDFDKATKGGDQDAIEEIENKIKTQLADFSQNYFGAKEDVI